MKRRVMAPEGSTLETTNHGTGERSSRIITRHNAGGVGGSVRRPRAESQLQRPVNAPRSVPHHRTAFSRYRMKARGHLLVCRVLPKSGPHSHALWSLSLCKGANGVVVVLFSRVDTWRGQFRVPCGRFSPALSQAPPSPSRVASTAAATGACRTSAPTPRPAASGSAATAL